MPLAESYPASRLADINALAQFLAFDQTEGASPSELARFHAPLLILLGNAILPVAEGAFAALASGAVSKILIAGGIGHSTELLYQAVKNHPRYASIATKGRSEAEILQDIAINFFAIEPAKLLLETLSTNCGDNATQARRVLDLAGDGSSRIILTQDPLMQRRTDASFRKVWQDRPEVEFINWPTFVPQLDKLAEELQHAGETQHSLWSWPRFASLLLGEIPRLRNDPQGYGPRGKDFIAAVDISPELEEAYARLLPLLGESHGDRSF
ncbi:MAG: YdcF family protein [Ewingella sp.]|uniref:YdcF family protein n=1 Tax=Ewingella TaxID=41201 RepID=UPI0033658F87